MATLVQLKVEDVAGRVNRDIIVPESISMYNLHRVLQFCIKPSQNDSTIDGKPFNFYHVATGQLVRGPKTTQLYRASPINHSAEVLVGDTFRYEADKGKYLVRIVAEGGGDDKFYVPRCIDGNAALDPINRKLLVRRFTKTGAGQMKRPPAVWCSRSTPASAIMASHLAAMQSPL